MPRKTKTAAQLDREIAHALSARRGRRKRSVHAERAAPTIANRDLISSRTLAVIGDELDDAAERAVAAGAVGDLEYQGAGATGIGAILPFPRAQAPAGSGERGPGLPEGGGSDRRPSPPGGEAGTERSNEHRPLGRTASPRRAASG